VWWPRFFKNCGAMEEEEPSIILNNLFFTLCNSAQPHEGILGEERYSSMHY